MKSPDWPPSTKGDVPKNEKRDAYKTSIENQIGSNLGLLNGNSFFSERLGGIERSINKSLVPALYDTPEHAASSVNYILDYFVENNVSTENQLQFLQSEIDLRLVGILHHSEIDLRPVGPLHHKAA
ncbi:MAG: hypothetical protein WCP55_10095 [Lentisphaerota bacterium]